MKDVGHEHDRHDLCAMSFQQFQHLSARLFGRPVSKSLYVSQHYREIVGFHEHGFT
jgi:hypothetical protein